LIFKDIGAKEVVTIIIRVWNREIIMVETQFHADGDIMMTPKHRNKRMTTTPEL